LPSREEIEQAGRIVYEVMQPTPQYSWPLLNERAGTEVWLKHENHTPLGTFKMRSGLVYFRRLQESGARANGVVTATRGNHGQAVGLAARREGVPAVIYVPRGNSRSKNRAMVALSVELREFGGDFEEARREAERAAASENLHYVPSFHEWLLAGAATYSLELLRAVADIDIVYVPIGMGSGICGMAAAREALQRRIEIVGVVSERAPAYYDSLREGRPVERPAETELADGLACRAAAPDALDIIRRHVARVVKVSEAAVAAGMAILFDDTHNVVEGAGAAALAAALAERAQLRGKRVAVVVSGGNVDRAVYAKVIASSET
jgi:threonine dehydratase